VLAEALRASPEAASAGEQPAAPPPIQKDEPAQPNQPAQFKPVAPVQSSAADFSGLPPQMAASLAKLAGVPWPPKPEGESKKDEESKEESVGAAPSSSKDMPPR
jgi:hypothetical protein